MVGVSSSSGAMVVDCIKRVAAVVVVTFSVVVIIFLVKASSWLSATLITGESVISSTDS